ncbi:MAG: hypothetical protein B7X40_10665, partial [Cellulomonas sp. 14-74-6]
FAPPHLAATLADRRTARIAAMRSTVHLLTARDALTLPVLTARTLSRETRGLSAAELDRIAVRARELLERTPMRPNQLGPALARELPHVPPNNLAYAARCLLSLVQVTPRGQWGASMATTWATAESWFAPETVAAAPDLQDPGVRAEVVGDLVLRYLAAFGPASVADVQTWSGMTRLAPVVQALGDRVVQLHPLRASAGRNRTVLLDVPDAPRPDEDTPAPVRLLPDFDNVVLSHADRTRIVPEDVRRRLVTPNGSGPGTVLLDGQVGGVWRLRRERGTAGTRAPGSVTLLVEPFVALSAQQREELDTEAHGALTLLAGDVEDRRVEVAAAS